MRDEVDARLWARHQHGFSSDVDRVARSIRHGLARLRMAVPAPVKVMGVILAASLAALTAEAPHFV